MKDKCFKIGTIQAFVDGELPPNESERVVKHLSLCTGCAALMTEIEDESAVAFGALDGELNVLVPTERLRGKLFTAIDEIERRKKTGWIKKLTASLSLLGEVDFRSPSFVAFACALLFVGSFAVGLKVFPPAASIPDVAVDTGSDIDLNNSVNAPVVEKVESVAKPNGNDDLAQTITPKVSIAASSGATRRVRRSAQSIRSKPDTRNVSSGRTVPAVAGEDIFLSTISSLNQNIDQNKDELLRPKERVDFEKNLAMVDYAIKRMQDEVRKNPENNAARELLKTSYQNKIDLLNAVSDKNELMASIQ